MSLETVSVVGLGKLGAPIAAALAVKGARVIAVDQDAIKVLQVRQGIAPVREPGLAELMARAAGRLIATGDLKEATLQSSMSLVMVPTPSDPSGAFSLGAVTAVCEQLGAALREKGNRHLVVITSTVMPGSMEAVIQPTLERASGKRCGVEFGLCYNPVFVALGEVARNFLHPDVVLIGESDAQSGEALASWYRGVCENQPPIAKMNFINAELTKLALNTFVTTKITFANMLAQLCEQFPQADVDVVTGALGLDHRVGSAYLTGGASYGGPCFPRDNVAFARAARDHGCPARLPEATHVANEEWMAHLAELVLSRLSDEGTVGILGLAYKPQTEVIEGSPGVRVAEILLARGNPVVVYDPMAMARAQEAFGRRLQYASSPEDCVVQADVVVVATPWEAFQRIAPSTWVNGNRRRVIIDCWRLLRQGPWPEGVEYVPLGLGPRRHRSDPRPSGPPLALEPSERHRS